MSCNIYRNEYKINPILNGTPFPQIICYLYYKRIYEMKTFHLHLVSDATGETVQAVARACLVQFEGALPIEHIWTLVRNQRQLEESDAGRAG